MEVSRQLHALAVLTRGKNPPPLPSNHWIGGLVGPTASLAVTVPAELFRLLTYQVEV